MNFETNGEIDRIIASLHEFLPHAFEDLDDISCNFKRRLKAASLDELKVYNLKLMSIDENLQKMDEIVIPMEEDGREYAEIEASVKEDGIEALAYYRPFHYLPTELWGIYVPLYGLRYVKSIFMKSRFQRRFNIRHVIDVLWQ